MITWFKTLRRIINNYDTDREKTTEHVNSLCHANLRRILHAENTIIKNTSIHVDVHHKNEPNQIIVIGKYHGKDYINTFSIDTQDVPHLISVLRDVERHYLGRVKHVDTMPQLSAVIKKEVSREWE